MKCLICAGSAAHIQSSTGFEGRYCPLCGRYHISSDLVLILMEQGQIFDVDKMRIWLAERRKLVAIPVIEVHEALLAP